jgi:hypothetical protein
MIGNALELSSKSFDQRTFFGPLFLPSMGGGVIEELIYNKIFYFVFPMAQYMCKLLNAKLP